MNRFALTLIKQVSVFRCQVSAPPAVSVQSNLRRNLMFHRKCQNICSRFNLIIIVLVLVLVLVLEISTLWVARDEDEHEDDDEVLAL